MGQGDSPKLFLYYINALLEFLRKSELIFDVQSIKVGVIAYADDTSTLSIGIDKVKNTISLMETYCKKYDVLINAEKTV